MSDPLPITDVQRLDWLESKSDGTLWAARESFTGRGFRLHNIGPVNDLGLPAHRVAHTAREAIDAAMREDTNCGATILRK